MKVVVKVVMKVGMKVGMKVVNEGSDEGGEWLILCCWGGFEDERADRWTTKRTEICECRVASATENIIDYAWLDFSASKSMFMEKETRQKFSKIL